MLTAFAAQTLKFLDWLEKANTSPDIIAYFTTVLQQHDCPEDGTNFPNHMALACTAQGYIGWDNLMFGRVATEWQNLQHQYYRSISSRRSAERWAADITYHLLQFSHALWMARNRFLHERDEQGLLLAEGQNLTDAITQSYLRGRRALLPADYHLLETRSLEQLLKQQPSEKYTWLGAIRLAHRLAKDTRGTEQARLRESMRRYLNGQGCQPVAQNTPPRDEDSDEE